MSKIEQMEAELRKLSKTELREIRAWLDDIIEDELEFTPEFERAIQQSEQDMAEGRTVRVREPEGFDRSGFYSKSMTAPKAAT